MHIYRSRFLVRGEVWYDHAAEDAGVDWILYRQRSHPVAGARWRYFHTLLMDLELSPEALLGQMSESTAYQIRRARNKDGVNCECEDPREPKVMERFEEMYNRFAAFKGLDLLNRPLLCQMAEEGSVELTVARDRQANPLVYHAYYRDPKRRCLLHSASILQTLSESFQRNAVGRANRYLFWSDMLRWKEQGVKYFDFGGWYPGRSNDELLRINRFKEGFGGQLVREYNCEQIISLKGRVVLTAVRLLCAARSLTPK